MLSSSSHRKDKKKGALSARAQRQKRLPLKAWLITGTVIAAIVAGSLLAFTYWGPKETGLYDLSVIGKGVPVVVQVYDSDCSTCVALRANIVQIENEFGSDALQIKVADLKTQPGRIFAATYGVSYTTLVFFDPEGTVLEVQSGVQSAEILRQTFYKYSFLRR